MSRAKPNPSADLKRRISEQFVLNAAEEHLLLEACRTVDELERLADVVAGAEPEVVGSTGQPRANPLFEEVRRHRATLAALVTAMRLPAIDEVEGQAATTKRAQHAAAVRWRREKDGA